MKESALTQAVLRTLINTPSAGFISKVKHHSLMKVRAMLARNEDRVVRYQVDGTELLLPLSHQLPLYRSNHPFYSSNIGRIALCVTRKYPSATIIDIGANVGDTAAIIRANCNAHILCIEGDAYFFRILECNIVQSGMRGVEACFAFIGTEQSEVAGGLLHVNGTASYSPHSGRSISQIPLSEILVRFPNFRHSKLLKIDTDGFDCQILAAERKWLSVARPIAFIEYDPHLAGLQGYDCSRIFPEMESLGYERVVFWENTGEYLCTARLADHSLIADIHLHYLRSLGRSYADVAFVHEDDVQLGLDIREMEREHLGRSKGGHC